jgi:predicted KAP-like P-loop ATPase
MSSEWKLTPVRDEPIDDVKLLGLENTVEILTRFLSSNTLISPLVIAINGEWGSGKTSLINTIKKKLDKNKNKITTVFFDAWMYEYSDPAAALFYTIAKRLEATGRHMSHDAISLAKLVLDVFARRYTGMSVGEMQQHFNAGITGVTTISERLEKAVNETIEDKRIVVLIDDLDRCSLDNVLEILETLKLFLGIKNFIFVIAVDMSKIKLAWSYKYGKIDETANEGLKYLEKIFQIEKAIPVPTPEQVKEYLKCLIPHCPDDLIEVISLTGIKNPRNIKRLLNLISLRANTREEEQSLVQIAAILWTVFETLVGKKEASKLYNQSGGALNFYDFLRFTEKIPFDDALQTDDKKAEYLINTLSTDNETRNISGYHALLYNDTMDEIGVHLKRE